MCRFATDTRGLPAAASRAGLLCVALLCLAWAAQADAGQLGNLVSPGPLAKAHASVPGGISCQQCHEAGRRVTPAKCLTCHAPIAQRLAAKVGVHRNAQDCVSCHVEHAGADGDLRHFDTRRFAHAVETRFPLDGQHAKVSATCAACHKGRSFVQAQMSCASCHQDPHKGALGPTCTTCHSTAVPFAAAREKVDHASTRFPLTGAHQQVMCAQCHKSPTFKGVAFATCTACHQEPHEKRFGTACTSCHTTAGWTTKTLDHGRTGFPLKGAHQQVTCVKCHVSGQMTRPLHAESCASCHADVHRGVFKQDCQSCHTEQGFKGAPFDHGAKTSFALDGAHAALACVSCHPPGAPSTPPGAARTVSFSNAPKDCVGCHGGAKDPHKGAFGATCDACHQTRTFDVKRFAHPRMPEFFAGQHQPLTCDKCHLRAVALPALRPTQAVAALLQAQARPETPSPVAPVRSGIERGRPPPPPMACAACHTDVHLGQVGDRCEGCHDVAAPKFAAVTFSHANTKFALTGRHADVMCAACHRTETRAFPQGRGTAMVLHPDGSGSCQTCHQDPHLGQVSTACETCHSTNTFAVRRFTHTGMEDFFGGVHGRYECVACHKKETGMFPAGRGTAVRFAVGRSCQACHRGF